jgi:molecular chaperone HscB
VRASTFETQALPDSSRVLDFSKNHFELFGLPRSYRVNGDLLAERYRALQRALHPDRYAAAGDREKRLAMQASTRVNEAFQILKDPLGRACYLLSLHQGDFTYEKETTQDMAFLMEQMELREALAGVKSQNDPLAAVGEILNRLAEQSEVLVDELETLLEAPSAQDLEAAQKLVRRLQFVTKCRADAENLEAELDQLL